ncbi:MULTISPECIES: adenylate/guanylate cyclase domain-containing protein [Cyanophyceae]|uniref:adenylate/guanylate cyclase domain-containing protein n=1 Tax=Cyanophyceae TaxID=3028117 RepID=UPI0016865D9F|nr:MULTISPECIES: adenylate/guanylate cyclase domain-containing protein [Cyanophyceae]MBD1917034.1 GAF domain-containing protein [Phormidium sp. FACHB-77]MBD2030565.1 GAF domain-containing protein [Phormidium sp. FACHB-322]MBD2050327.1 GAF domain-containing protein [Leptolyngbya sp. FACHB-60]
MATQIDRSMITALSLVNQHSSLTNRVRDLPTPQFISLLDQITAEFEHFLRAIDMINNESLEVMLEQILEAFTLKIGQILQAERTTIFMVDQEKQELWSKIAQGDGERSLEIRVPMGKGISGHVATHVLPLNIPDAYADERFDPTYDKKTGYRTRSILCMPVLSKKTDNIVAVVQLLNKLNHAPFDEQDERHFKEFAESLGVILESCNSFYIAARNQKGVAALLKAISSLEQSLDLEKTLQSVMGEARQLMQADRSTLWLIDDESGDLWSKVKSGDGKSLVELRIPISSGIVGHVATTGEVLNIPDAYQDPRFNPDADKRTGYRTRNILCMPVYDSGGKLIAVTQLINKAQGTFTTSDEAFMRAFNIQAGVALENAKLFESVLVEKQYQKDILQSLSDAVISTDMEGRIITINDAALQLIGCPEDTDYSRTIRDRWCSALLHRPVWETIPVESLRFRIEDSLKSGARHYVPEQSLRVAIAPGPGTELDPISTLALPDNDNPALYHPWGDPSATPVPKEVVQIIERSINLTVNPLTNPEGGVLGGLLVLEDISQEKRMKSTLYRYMTPGVAERVMALGDDLLMKGERKDVTVLFSDIRGYTTLTEDLEADKVVEMLNAYFETMVESVFHFEGTLDKFIGDALMAVFGAPLPLTNHAWAAVQSALDMRRRLAKFNGERGALGQPKIRIGIGVSSGEVVSGNIGSQRKMEYTVIGDGVNLSSRLEGVTKEYGCDIVISEYTYALCADKIWARELDRTQVKGKQRAVGIYELIDQRDAPLTPGTEAFLDLYAQARSAYTAMQFEQALRLFEQAQQMRPDDKAVTVHLSRARQYLVQPPPEDWDGVYIMTTK